MTLGKSVAILDGVAKIRGQARYPDDLPHDGLYARLLFSDRPHARLLSLDTSAAEALPGVVAIFGAADVPNNLYGLKDPDQPVFLDPRSVAQGAALGANVSRWEADRVVLVIAESEAVAARACRRVETVWEDLPTVTTVDEAMRDETLLEPGATTNTLAHLELRVGDVDAAFEASCVTVESTYEIPGQEHAYLQTEAATSRVDRQGRVVVEVAGQWAHGDQRQIARALDLPEELVRVVYPAIGGAFGGREDVSLQIVMALAAWRLHQCGEPRAIRARWTREQSIVGHCKRHAVRARTRWGAYADGRISAIEADLVIDAGAYRSTSEVVLANLHFAAAGPYTVEAIRLDSRAVLTNNVPGGAARGFGVPQAAFIAEQQMNKLAEALAMDPVEIRRLNALRDGSLSLGQTPMPAAVSLEEVLQRCAEAAARPVARREATLRQRRALVPSSSLRRGRGFACGFKNVGYSFGYPESSTTTLELHGTEAIDRVVLRQAAADVGQGAHVVCRQMAAAALDIELEVVELITGDTAATEDCGSCSASRMTLMAGRSIQEAARLAQAKWNEGERPAIATATFHPPATTTIDPTTGHCLPHFAYAYFAEAVDVVVDIDTGEIQIERVVCADDVGRAIHPVQVKGQLEGGIVQALGWALTEELRLEGGRISNPTLSGYLIPTVADAPAEIESVIVEVPDPVGPWGARGVGEPPFIGLAPALTAALHDATGIWFDRLPLLPERVSEELMSAPPPPGHEDGAAPARSVIRSASTSSGRNPS